tara:strand:- start:1562 stop:1855 length:294 start_codon:yes stop_codon:yes gene_type:complete
MQEIDSRLIELEGGILSLPMENLTKDYEKDIKVVSYYIVERLPKTSKFNLKNWEIDQYNEERVLLRSDNRPYLILIHNIVTSDGIMDIEYTTYLINE